MTEARWLECTDPEPILALLQGKTSERKLRLFAVACCRRIWSLLSDERSRKAVEVAEMYADSLVGEKELAIAAEGAYAAAIEDRAFNADPAAAPEHAALYTIGVLSSNGVKKTIDEPSFDVVMASFSSAAAIANRANLDDSEEEIWESILSIELEAQSQVFRDILGNPFRPIALDPSWLTPNVIALAQSIYNDRTFLQMPTLADELQKAGCANQETLNHCRQPGPHVQGCWVVDLILGKG